MIRIGSTVNGHLSELFPSIAQRAFARACCENARASVIPFGGDNGAELASALDEWAMRASAEEEATWARAVASLLDDDPLRVLRVVRFACKLGFSIDEATRRAMSSSSRGLQRVAGERRERGRVLDRAHLDEAARLQFVIQEDPKPAGGPIDHDAVQTAGQQR